MQDGQLLQTVGTPPGIIAAAMALLLAACGAVAAPKLRVYDTRYYTIHTDLDEPAAREAAIRMTRMAEEYAARTRGFSGRVPGKLPFYLYRNAEDFWALGAPRSTAGYFNGRQLVATAADLGPRTWHIVQHEGFHQFAHAAIGTNLPVWVNEGLAEYFGEALFTGDGFITGAIPQWRLKRVRDTIADGGFRPLQQMMSLSKEQWNADFAIVNYDQGWTMVQFLAHGDGGKYQQAFATFVGRLSAGQAPQDAWQEIFGDIDQFQVRWLRYWNSLPDNPTLDVYARANVATLTSFLARAHLLRQRFESFQQFMQAAQNGQVNASDPDWLPPSLLSEAIQTSDDLIQAGCRFDLKYPNGGQDPPQITCTMGNGSKITGKFTIHNGRVGAVTAR
ncbi:DUF1570 domain-containing protein [Fontivita pretiosa]|uniref:DUF1570 domain-containing protein n=1 Tax=Fontivita pretiosa TaxID=2989684 RepID=UPI003D16A5DA